MQVIPQEFDKLSSEDPTQSKISFKLLNFNYVPFTRALIVSSKMFSTPHQNYIPHITTILL